MKSIIALLIVIPVVASAGEMWLDEWLEKNEPIVKKYLLSLRNSDIGKTIKGVTLADGKEELKNAVYLGNESNSEKGYYIFKFKTVYAGVTYENYYMWSNPSSNQIEFPVCNGEWLVPGGQAVLSGDNYTYSSVQPTGQLVVTHCKVTANKAPQPTPKSGAAEL